MKKLYVKKDEHNPNIIIVGGRSTKELKQFLKQNYGAMYDSVNKEWLINNDEQKFDLDEKKLYGQLRAKTVDRALQREFGTKVSEDDNEENRLQYGKAILVFMEKVNVTQIKKATDELQGLREAAKKNGENLNPRQEATLSYLNSTMLAVNSLTATGILKMGNDNHIAYFEKWQDRQGIADELNSIRKQTMFDKRAQKYDAQAEEEEQVHMQR